jgi:hypothetical protein
MILKISQWLLLLTFASIFLVSKLYVNSKFGLRPEDFVGFLCILFLPILVLKTSHLIPKRILIITLLYFYYLLVISLLQGVEYTNNIFVLYFKELSYFSYFLAAFYFFYNSSEKNISRFWTFFVILSVPNVLYLYYQLITGNTLGMYGVSFYGHGNSPASSGLLGLAVFFLVYFYYNFVNNNLLIFFYLIATLIIVFFIGSKLAVIGALSFYFMMTILERNFSKFFSSIFVILIIGFVLNYSINSGLGALHRLDQVFSPFDAIINRGIWFKFQWIEGIFGFIFGGGLKMGHISSDLSFSYGMAMDNQFLYFLLVLGITGSLIFFYLLILLITSLPRGSRQRKVQISLTISYFSMGMGAEVFQLSISGLIFWIISGLLLGYSNKISYGNKTVNNSHAF